MTTPTYDIALLAPHLVGAPAVEIGLGDEIALGGPKAPQRSQTIFWAVLFAAVLVLLLILARLLRTRPQL